MKEKELWDFIGKCVYNASPVMLVVVAESHGASPGRARFKMAIARGGDRRGTIGGGVMEANIIATCQQRLAAGEVGESATVRHLFHSSETIHESSGLICSGSQTILIKSLSVENVKMIDEIRQTFERHRCGKLVITPSDVVFSPDKRTEPDSMFDFVSENEWQYQENIGILDTVFVVGSGHVGLALSRVMATLDFRVVAVDDRVDAPTFLGNSFAHQRIHCRYEDVHTLLCSTGREYVAVLTTSYMSDEAVLKGILDKNLQYVGLMGSAAKTKQIFNDLISEGIPESMLHRIHTPIGIPIDSHTPEEIAISIAAEIIKTRNQSQS